MASGKSNGLHGENEGTFEGQFDRLQEVVRKLSEGNLTLQEALQSFEEGMALTDRCARMLDEAELRVKQISERTLRSAQASLDELEDAVRAGQVSGGALAEGVLAVEIETFESAVLIDRSNNPTAEPPGGNLAYGPLRGERGAGAAGNAQGSRTHRSTPSSPSSPPSSSAARPSDSDWDPLFDEEE